MRRVALACILWVLLALTALPGMALAQAPDGARIDQAHLFVAPGETEIVIAEYHLLGNTAESETTGTVRFSLPAGATSLVFEGAGEADFLIDEAGFTDPRPIPPGEATSDVGFSYALPFVAGQAIARVYDMPVDALAIVLSGEDFELAGAGLTLAGMQETPMGGARVYSAGPLAAGEPLVFTLVPIETVPPTPPDQRDPAQELIVGLAALALAGFVAYYLWQPVRVPPMPAGARPLITDIAALDARFAAGEIAEPEYHDQRQRAIREVIDFLKSASR